MAVTVDGRTEYAIFSGRIQLTWSRVTVRQRGHNGIENRRIDYNRRQCARVYVARNVCLIESVEQMTDVCVYQFQRVRRTDAHWPLAHTHIYIALPYRASAFLVRLCSMSSALHLGSGHVDNTNRHRHCLLSIWENYERKSVTYEILLHNAHIDWVDGEANELVM